MKKEYTREELIQICKDAIVPCEKWNDRDSYSSQVLISDIHALLSTGAEFEIGENTDDDTIWIYFKNLTEEQKNNRHQYQLSIDSREDYFEKRDPDYETEMFDGHGIDINSSYLGGYMPTRKRLEESNGEDWY